ncbi:unnamed protein product [Rotaria sp. Silwood1]|nr:unnamed protein product [Rotaria sp. Silwood1]CAF1060596.1 unnamed protein product [Rotaria sp. Silwood1]CAF3404429.1 unnamed protein product [Rotaria sp. Silwood1]CAF3417324.1 unnamed protein product [Rotaria sp. Silwood1]CAF3426727.1 unnamed protein product [Rotaria sp. Silwood1]
MALRCDLCRIEVPDEHVLADHTKGKRHQALLNARERYESSQNSSIYVSRIKSEHDENILKEYFSRFGQIKNCFIDKEKHIYAIIEYENIDSAHKCLEYSDEHKLDDGSRLKVKQRNHHEFKSKRMLISEQEFLNINKEKEIEQHAIMVQNLNNKLTIDEQAETIIEQEKITDELLKMREEFFKELEIMFVKYFPEAKLCLTGSMANNLATNLSDMDLVLILNDTYIEPQHLLSSNNSGESMNINENSCSNDIDMNQNKFKRNASDESSNHSLSPPLQPSSFSADDLLQMSVTDRLDYIRRLLRSYAAYVCHVQRIAQARCPVVRFCHKQQKIFCELSINNHLAVANTELIRYFLVFEPKLRSLLYTIRLWLKQKDLLGKGYRFNTYTIFWMIVCTLQLDNKQLPNVQTLTDCATHKRHYGPWNCSVPDINKIERNISNISIEHMLHNFFLFYSTFNANQYELSPWTGKLESKTSNTIPFSIFDPFEHDHNLTSNISQSNWLKFQEECFLANQILDECSKKRQHKSWGLSLILTRKSLPKENFIHEQQQQYHHTESTHKIELNFSKQINEEQIEKNIEFILKDILLFEQINYDMIRKKRPASPTIIENTNITPNSLAEKLDETLSSKRRRIDDDEYTSTPIKDRSYSKEKIYFQVIYRTWQDRRKHKRHIDNENNNLSIFDREKLISNKLKEDKNHHLETPIYLSMEIKFLPTTIDNRNNKVQLRLESQTNEQHQLFVDLSHFLNLYLPKMLETQSTN